MKIQQVKITNFGSYDILDFDFTDQGLTLISGPTGAGKSTLLDVVPWILFGVTAKGGSVEEVVPWTGGVTEGTIYLDNVTISRKRGSQNKDNDLMFWPTNGQTTRGKDLKDTQKLIDNFLGINAEQYLLGAYFHEFSETSRFFTTTAANRRKLTENICDFSVPNKIREKAKIKRKDLEDELDKLDMQHQVLNGQRKMLNTEMNAVYIKAKHWAKETINKIEELKEKQQNFDTDKANLINDLKQKSKLFENEQAQEARLIAAEIYSIEQKTKDEDYFTQVKESIIKLIANIDDDVCEKCGALKDSMKKIALTEDFHATKMLEQENNQNIKKIKTLRKDRDKTLAAINPYRDQIIRESEKENTFATQVKEAEETKNPYNEQFSDMRHKHVTISKEMDVIGRKQDELKVEISDLSLLIDLTDVYRTSLVNSAILDLERKTNKYLSDYFDAEIKVKFESAEADKLEVSISKDGNVCSYTQLSRGQRQLLRLCFAVSVMKAAQNFSAIDFNTVFFDEFTDGLDEGLEVKIFNLLQQLASEHESVIAVDHSEALKSLFTNRYNVELINGVSRIAEA